MSYYYLDNNGTTIMPNIVKNKIVENLLQGNPSAKYPDAVKCKEKIDYAREKLLQYCQIDNSKNDYKVIYTSGASESNNYVFNAMTEAFLKKHKGACEKKPYIITTSIEHKTSINRCKNLENTGIVNVIYIKPNAYGIIEENDIIQTIMQLLRKNETIILVSIMHANNETGNYNRLLKVIELCDINNIFFHSDIVATFGKYPHFLFSFKYKPAAVSISFHKLFGPTQCGALILKRKFLIYDSRNADIQYKIGAMISGTQYDGYRGGTENISLIMGSVAAMDLSFTDRIKKNTTIRYLRNLLIRMINDEICTVLNHTMISRLENNRLYCIVFTKINKLVIDSGDLTQYESDIFNSLMQGTEPDMESNNVLNMCFVYSQHNQIKTINNFEILDSLLANKIIISTGSACNKTQESYVIKELGVPEALYKNPLRISFGDLNIMNDKKIIMESLTNCVQVLKKIIKLKSIDLQINLFN